MRALPILLILAACSPGPDALSRQLDIMRDAGASSADLCDKAREVAAAWLKREDEQQYRIANDAANLQCNRARLD